MVAGLLLALQGFVLPAHGQYRRDSLRHVQGARGLVPCNDGSFVGGYVGCGTLDSRKYFRPCTLPIVNRSWDGGVTWMVEPVDASDYSYANLVRLRGGLLLSPLIRWRNKFALSTDGGRSWKAEFDSTNALRATSVNDMTAYVYRDVRGIVYWKGAGILRMSMDDGNTFVSRDALAFDNSIYVSNHSGVIMCPMVETSQSMVEISTDFGRTWSEYRGYDTRDSLKILNGIAIVRDTIVIDAQVTRIHANWTRTYEYNTDYYHAGSRTWVAGQFRGYGLQDGCDVDSTGLITYSCSGTAVFAHKHGYLEWGDTTNAGKEIIRWDNPTDSTDCMGEIPCDSVVFLGTFMDLDGNIHLHGSNVYVAGESQRPVSLLDRLYTCTGVELVVGGKSLHTIELDESRSQNTRMTYTIADNQRLATVNVNQVDTTKPMYFVLKVHDVVLGNQTFFDSVLVDTIHPRLTTRGAPLPGVRITCQAFPGMYMWYKDGKPLGQEGAADGTIKGDSLLENAATGSYYVVARNRFGCDVQSNTVHVSTTGLPDPQEETITLKAYGREGALVIESTVLDLDATTIRLYNLLGQPIVYTTRHRGDNEVVLDLLEHSGVVIANVQSSDGRTWYARAVLVSVK